MRFALLLVLTPWLVSAQDRSLVVLHDGLAALRPHANEHRETRGATEALTVAKHRLRDWIESQLTSFPLHGGEDKLARDLADRLRAADLMCEPRCAMSILGFIDVARVTREGEFIVIRTSVGIWCGYDDSAYAYQWSSSAGWRRVWETEQDTYAPKRYLPQDIHAVHISPAAPDGSHLVLSLGAQTGCASAFQPVYNRVWRLRENHAKLILDESEYANVGNYPPTQGEVSPSGIRIQMTLGGTGYGSGHEAIRHYTVHATAHGDQVQQVDPIAPTPRDFVEEWLASPWAKSAAHSQSASLQAWHAKLHRTDGMGDFPGPELPCSSDRSLRQVSAHFHDAPEMYYLVRSLPPDHFKMEAVSDRAFPDCQQ